MSVVKRILVTGGAGFLGSHLCERLVAAGHDVICLDNFFTSQKCNVAHLIGRPNFELIRHDVTVPIHLEVDMIYNLACPAAPGHYQYNPIKTVKTSVMGAINMLGMAKRCRARVLQASTSEVYGDPEIHPQPETYRGNVNPIGPRACYDEGKRAAETLFMDYHRMNRVDIRIVRIFNTYGPRMHPFDGRVVSNFIRQALAGEDITIFGDGNQTRSFCYCDDLIDGLMRMMEQDSDFVGPVNLGNPGEFSIRELAELVLELTESKSQLGLRAASHGRPRPPPPGHHAGRTASGMEASRAAARGADQDHCLVPFDRRRPVSPAHAELLAPGDAASRASRWVAVKRRRLAPQPIVLVLLLVIVSGHRSRLRAGARAREPPTSTCEFAYETRNPRRKTRNRELVVRRGLAAATPSYSCSCSYSCLGIDHDYEQEHEHGIHRRRLASLPTRLEIRAGKQELGN